MGYDSAFDVDSIEVIIVKRYLIRLSKQQVQLCVVF